MATFELKITSGELARGLRYSKRVPRDSKYAVECLGAVGINDVLTTLEEITRMATSAITDGFPYPQIFIFRKVIIVCSSTKIYEWVDNALVEEFTVSAGTSWRGVDFGEYVYLSNGAVAVTRTNGLYELSATLPAVRAMCNMNGQIIVGGIL